MSACEPTDGAKHLWSGFGGFSKPAVVMFTIAIGIKQKENLKRSFNDLGYLFKRNKKFNHQLFVLEKMKSAAQSFDSSRS